VRARREAVRAMRGTELGVRKMDENRHIGAWPRAHRNGCWRGDFGAHTQISRLK